MRRKDLIACLQHSAAMLELADKAPPCDHSKDVAKWRANVQAANQGQAKLLRYAAQELEAGCKIDD